MLLLAIDTSGRNGSLALASSNESGDLEILELLPLAGRMYSAQLIPQIKVALERQGATKKDLDVLVVVAGPGSFTGLRVGLSTVKALGEVLRKAIVPVSVLQAAARLSGLQGQVVVAVDAGRQQVFVGEYVVSGDLLSSSSRESLLPLADFLADHAGSAAQIVTPDRVVLESAQRQGISVHEISPVQADTVARLGFELWKSGQSVTPEALEPNYIRPSDAELFSLPKPQP